MMMLWFVTLRVCDVTQALGDTSLKEQDFDAVKKDMSTLLEVTMLSK